MPDPPPRAPTFPAFVDQVPEVDDTEFIKSQVKPAVESPSPLINMTDPSDAVPTTTPTTSSASDAVPVVPLPVAQSKSKIRAILLWRDPKISGIFFGADMLFFYLTLVRKLSVLSVIGFLFGLYLVIGLILVNINKYVGGKLDKYIARPPPGTPLFKRESFNRITDTIVEEGNEIASELRDIIYCDKTTVTLGWTFAAVMIYYIGMFVSLVTVFFIGTLLLFSVPLIYEKNKKQVDDAVAKASDAASRHIETGRKAAVERASQLRETAAQKSAPYLEKAPPAARNLAEKIGLTPQKRKPE